MSTPDLWQRLWQLVLTYPALAFMFGVILCLLGTLVALALLSGSRPRIPLQQWEEDDEQYRAVSGRAPLEPLRRSGSSWDGKL